MNQIDKKEGSFGQSLKSVLKVAGMVYVFNAAMHVPKIADLYHQREQAKEVMSKYGSEFLAPRLVNILSQMQYAEMDERLNREIDNTFFLGVDVVGDKEQAAAIKGLNDIMKGNGVERSEGMLQYQLKPRPKKKGLTPFKRYSPPLFRKNPRYHIPHNPHRKQDKGIWV